MVESDICSLGLSLNNTAHCYKTTTCADQSTKGPAIIGEQNCVVCLGNGTECNRSIPPPSLRWLLFSVGKFIIHMTEPLS